MTVPAKTSIPIVNKLSSLQNQLGGGVLSGEFGLWLHGKSH